MTERLYYRDAYRTRFTSTLEAVTPHGEGLWALRLAATCFYPTSGGQMHDTGEVAGRAVVDVIEEAGEVLHLVRRADDLQAGAVLEGRVDEVRRAHHRQQHTGQHVLSRILEDRLGLPTVSSRLGESGNTLDLEIDQLDQEVLDAAEDAANRIVWEGRPVRVRFFDPATADAVDRGKIPTGQEQLRVIEIEGFDRNACGGTHCANTAEIGLVAVTRTEKVRSGVRVHFLCGQAAARHRRERDRLVARLGQALTCGADEIETAVARQAEEARAAARRAQDLARRLAAHRAGAWAREAIPVEVDGRRVRVVCRALEEEWAAGLGEAVARLVQEQDMLCALVAPVGPRCQVVVARGGGIDLDCGAVLREGLAELGGKGGGRPERAQGGYEGPAAAGVEALLRRLGLAGTPGGS